LTDPERISTHVSAFALNVSLTPLAIRVASAAVASPVVISGAVVVSGAVEIAGEAEAAASLIAAPVATCLDAADMCRVSKPSVAVSRTISATRAAITKAPIAKMIRSPLVSGIVSA
jgi:hypothetical protein